MKFKTFQSMRSLNFSYHYNASKLKLRSVVKNDESQNKIYTGFVIVIDSSPIFWHSVGHPNAALSFVIFLILCVLSVY